MMGRLLRREKKESKGRLTWNALVGPDQYQRGRGQGGDRRNARQQVKGGKGAGKG